MHTGYLSRASYGLTLTTKGGGQLCERARAISEGRGTSTLPTRYRKGPAHHYTGGVRRLTHLSVRVETVGGLGDTEGVGGPTKWRGDGRGKYLNIYTVLTRCQRELAPCLSLLVELVEGWGALGYWGWGTGGGAGEEWQLPLRTAGHHG